MMMRHAVALCFCATLTTFAQQSTVFEDRPALVLSNDQIDLTIVTEGGAMAAITLKSDKEKINPLWNPYWIARQAGLNRPASFARGRMSMAHNERLNADTIAASKSIAATGITPEENLARDTSRPPTAGIG